MSKSNEGTVQYSIANYCTLKHGEKDDSREKKNDKLNLAMV